MTGAKSAPTLEDVAKAAGVSTATVSRCLNTPDRVVEKTRTRVMQVIADLGYTPNFGARVMAAKRTFTIGAIIPTMDNAIFARGVQAFQEGLHDRGYTLLVASSGYRPDFEQEQIRALISRGADGLMLIGHDRSPEIYDYLDTQNVPVLAAWTYAKDAPLPSIGFDNRAAMRALADEVLRFGHTEIGMISAVTEGNDRARQRVEGLRDAMDAKGLDPDGLSLIETRYEIDCGSDAFAALMASQRPPTAILCGNDVIAVGAVHRARDMGLDVPGDVSITGFDDMELARLALPPLTTVHVPHQEMGRRAADALVDMVERKNSGISHELPTSLCIRQSLGPVPT